MDLADEIIYGTKESVERILQSGSGVNELDKYGFTPLMEAAICSKTDIAKLLLARGAIIDSPDMTGRTALHWAVDDANYSLCQLLLEHKANPNAYTKACQPVLTFPLLRGQAKLKDLLYQHGANLNFAQDFINTKLIGHRYELEGQVHIVDCDGQFILLDFEGFFLEFTLSIIYNSLHRYKNNFAAKAWHSYAKKLNKILECLNIAGELIKYQHFNIEFKEYENRINRLLDHNLILVPVAYEGHAITCMKSGDLWVKCDRGYNSRTEGSVIIYRVLRPQLLTKNFIKDLIYKKHSREYVNEGINDYLGLVKLTELPLPAQVIGNCSWANVEASVPTLLFLLLLQEYDRYDPQQIIRIQDIVMNFFDQWREWDKDRALEECMQSFNDASPPRQAAKIALLAAVLAQKCRYDVPHELRRAEKILGFLLIPQYQFILESYLKVYVEHNKTEIGENLMHLLDLAAPKGMINFLREQPIE